MKALLATLSQQPAPAPRSAKAAYAGTAQLTGQFETYDPDQLCFGPLRELLLGRIAGGFGQPAIADAFDNLKTTGLKAHSFKTLAAAGARAGAIGAVLSTVYSGIHAGSDAIKGRMTTAEAVGQVGTEALGGFLVGSASGMGSGLAMWSLRSIGLAGIPLSLCTATAGAVSGWSSAKLYASSGLRQAASQKLTQFAQGLTTGKAV